MIESTPSSGEEEAIGLIVMGKSKIDRTLLVTSVVCGLDQMGSREGIGVC